MPIGSSSRDVIQDVICMAIPEEVDPELLLHHEDVQIRTAFIARLTAVVQIAS